MMYEIMQAIILVVGIIVSGVIGCVCGFKAAEKFCDFYERLKNSKL